MARTDAQLNLRLPAELKARLEKAADGNKRSMTAEVVSRLDAGMPANVTLRDYFAAKAMNGLLSLGKFKQGVPVWVEAYQIADGMLAERSQ